MAHLPESALSFAIEGNGWNGGLPTVIPESGSTVWGAVFSIPQREMKTLDGIELAEQRNRVESDAIDRSGRRHRVSLHRATDAIGSELAPSPEYLGRMLAGSRHWELPVGWIVSLDDRLAEIVESPGRSRAGNGSFGPSSTVDRPQNTHNMHVVQIRYAQHARHTI